MSSQPYVARSESDFTNTAVCPAEENALWALRGARNSIITFLIPSVGSYAIQRLEVHLTNSRTHTHTSS